MNKYFFIIRNTWDEIATYRFNFAMWRLRNVLQLVTVYYLWLIVTPVHGQIFGYSQSLILTYILGAAFLSSIIMATRTQEIGNNINSGDLSSYLVRPFNYFGFWFARDLGDKASNIGFAIVELVFFYFIFKPSLFIQTNLVILLLFITAIALAIMLNFFVGCLLGMIGFWSSEIWAPRFIFFILISFLAGGAFPLDIFPQVVSNILQFLPFTYFLYFPLKIYLGGLTTGQIFSGLLIAILWVGILSLLTRIVWTKGLKFYSAQGN
ncbi:MAG TPA: ABC-2 family transporter protein [Patescibacteria group bacterium]